MKIKFNKKKHKYSINGVDYISVTTFINQFFEPFNAKEVAKKLSTFPHNKAQKKGIRFWLNKWKKTQEDGTKVHKELEEYILSLGQIKGSLLKSTQGEKYLNDHHLLHNSLPEVKVFSDKYKLAGTIDLLSTIDKDTSQIIISDWKTSEKIDKTGYKGKVGIHNATKGVVDSNFWHYSIQLNLYKRILQEQGLNVIELRIIHLQDDKYTIHIVPDMSEIIDLMLEERK